MGNGYKGPFWVFIYEATGMPGFVEKCTFQPTILPGKGEWIEVHAVGLKRIEELAAKITGHQEAMRPLLDEWSRLNGGE